MAVIMEDITNNTPSFIHGNVIIHIVILYEDQIRLKKVLTVGKITYMAIKIGFDLFVTCDF